jgi:predicted nucleic acid-binding protein
MLEKKWVFDTVALSNFLLSDSIFILAERYRKCGVITWQVYDEISAGIAEYPELKQVDKLIEDKTFKLVSLSRKSYRHFLHLIGHLGKGEASCVAFAKEQAAIVVTDDRSARKQCSSMKITVTGTVGILKASVLDGHISLATAEESLRKMIEAGFYSPVRGLADIL